MFIFPSLSFILLFLINFLTTSSENANNNKNLKTTENSTQIKIQFEPFKKSTEYRCGAFGQQFSQKDPAMKILHSVQNGFIKTFSEPFPHRTLLSDEALLGQKDAWERSFTERRDHWIQFERWWLLLALFLISIPPIFAILYLFIRCCICLCKQNSEKSNRENDSDRRCDWLRRALLNGLLGIFVLIIIFCSAVLLLSTQYAQHGLDELPTRLHYCANDLLIYRGESVEQMRKLLRDDFVRFNQTLHSALDKAGESTVQRLKQVTGVERLDKAVISASNAPRLLSTYKELQLELGKTLDARHSLQIKLLKLRQAKDNLADCEKTSENGEKSAICHQAKQAINPILELAKSVINEEEEDGINVVTGDWQLEQRAREISSLLPEQIPIVLNQIEQIDIERRFATPIEGLQILQKGIQTEVDERREDAEERLRLLDKTLQSNYEQISSAIKSVDLRFLDEQIIDPMMAHRERFRQFVHYGWVASLIVSGLFAFLSLAFLLGLCFGCCGRRPSEFEDDDCCVRSTGANFFGCSIWLSLALLSVFGLISASGMLIGANLGHLICNPLKEPLARPDIISFFDRLITIYELDKPKINSEKINSFQQIFTEKRRPENFIRGCNQGKTLYLMLELDKKFTLINGGNDNEYEEMANSIRQSLLSGRLLEKALAGPPSTSSSPTSTAFSSRWNSFGTEMRIGLEELGQVEIPEWKENNLQEFCAQRTRFQLEGVTVELRHLRQSSEEKQKGQVEELETVLHFLEELRPDTVQVRALIENVCSRLEQFRSDVFALKIDSESLLKDVEKAQKELGSEQKLRQNLHSVALKVANEFADLVRQYGEHINNSMNNEVTSCAPLAEIAVHTREAICDYALDPINSLWLSLGLGLLLLLPIIVLASILNPLYRRTNAYSQYNVPSITDCPNENHFQTDIYNMDSNNYISSGGGTSKTARVKNNLNSNNGYTQHYHHGNYQPPCTQITSPYASSYAGYGYTGLGPPVYMGTNRG
uniref:Uncharacterized protein n=1 Tax=Meloidogyne enterolobii TaxID=390850 RepID=A0A6V7WPE2_MELEN|nr:unnamed protein product [Meloidogyne enterolobii]